MKRYCRKIAMLLSFLLLIQTGAAAENLAMFPDSVQSPAPGDASEDGSAAPQSASPAPESAAPENNEESEDNPEEEEAGENEDYIKWVSFDIPYDAMKRAADADIGSYATDAPVNWIEVLALLAARYWGKWRSYKASDLNTIVYKLQNGESAESLAEGYNQYEYYYEAYCAVLSGFIGYYAVQLPSEGGAAHYAVKYGMKAYSPIAKGFWYNHYDDFGNSRTYGFSRRHLGNDLMGSVGSPIIAVESGIVEAAGWNQYGGWRIGIRSFDGMRYYYYAHLRKDRPYAAQIKVGQTVKAGDVIGYMGRTGYSRTENVNNIKTVHLHFGMQIIFDKSQEDGNGEIWIDVYQIVRLLAHNRSEAVRDEETKEFSRKYDFYDLAYEDFVI